MFLFLRHRDLKTVNWFGDTGVLLDSAFAFKVESNFHDSYKWIFGKIA